MALRNGAFYLATSLAVLAGCSAQKVHFDYDRQVDFSSYETYTWYQGENTLAYEFPLAHQRFTAAVDPQLRSKGLRKVDSNPDVYVTYFGEDKENVSIDTDHFGYGYADSFYWGGGLEMGSSTSHVRTYTTGTLVVDIWDAAKERGDAVHVSPGGAVRLPLERAMAAHSLRGARPRERARARG